MNYKTTKKAVTQGYHTIIYTSYCNLQNLLRYNKVESHTERAEGWGADIYHINHNTCIVTGYAPFGNIRADYDICRKYDDIASRMTYSLNVRHDMDDLIDKFVAEVTNHA